ncbi:cob(I)yrinic acid a,c-diamide adenosyltransferase [Candidatus Bipolaricaulota bacterium]|nr:cob(I)yrinic acid a,c-diamide adenosyltransferase [Candidatus Bipolaricaulota bacterium]
MARKATRKRRGLVYLYTGEGGGKTTNAFGFALRAIGHGYKVIIIQFMKGWEDIGEVKACRRLAPECEIYQFGRKEFVDPKNPSPEDRRLAEAGLALARKLLKKKPKLLVLDEINLAAAFGLVKVKDVLKLLDEVPPSTVVMLTGRRAPRALIDRADFVSVIEDVKHPAREGIPARKGIEY